MQTQIYNELTKIYSVFNLYFEKLKEINQILKEGNQEKIHSISEETITCIENGTEFSCNYGKNDFYATIQGKTR